MYNNNNDVSLINQYTTSNHPRIIRASRPKKIELICLIDLKKKPFSPEFLKTGNNRVESLKGHGIAIAGAGYAVFRTKIGSVSILFLFFSFFFFHLPREREMAVFAGAQVWRVLIKSPPFNCQPFFIGLASRIWQGLAPCQGRFRGAPIPLEEKFERGIDEETSIRHNLLEIPLTSSGRTSRTMNHDPPPFLPLRPNLYPIYRHARFPPFFFFLLSLSLFLKGSRRMRDNFGERISLSRK